MAPLIHRRETVARTAAQALVKFLGAQYSGSDGVGHGSVVDSTQDARKVYDDHKATPRLFLTPTP
jgi:hypothetical protein